MGTRKLTPWNKFVQRVYADNKHRPGFSFTDALREASRLKKAGKMSSGSDGDLSSSSASSSSRRHRRRKASGSRRRRASRRR